jgi:hypothetical protein
MCMAQSGSLEKYDRPQSKHCQTYQYQHASVLVSQDHVCVTVGVERAVGRENKPYAVESLIIDPRRLAH